MADQAKNFMIGLFVVAAISIVIFILLFLHPSVGNEERILHVRFSDIDKISVGTRVTFAGKPVGEVTQINEVRSAEENRIGRDGHVYVYELTLRVDSGVNVFNTDEIAARTSGLLGEKSIAIIPRPPKPGEQLRIVNDEILYATESGSVEDTFKEFRDLAGKFEEALDAVTGTIKELDRQKLWEKIGNVAQNVSEITGTLNKPEELTEILDNLHRLSERFNKSWKTVDVSLRNLATTTANTRDLTQTGKDIIADVRAGKGTIGSLLEKNDLYLKASSLLSKGDVVLNDINHYGLLYQSDKGWQRLRARRMNLLGQLSSPQEFRNYFNDEIDQIQTSLERVATILDQTNNICPPGILLENPDFNCVFSELLRRIKTLEEEVNMYNQQISDEAAKTLQINCEAFN